MLQKYTIQLLCIRNVYRLFIKCRGIGLCKKKNPGQDDRGLFFEMGR